MKKEISFKIQLLESFRSNSTKYNQNNHFMKSLHIIETVMS